MVITGATVVVYAGSAALSSQQSEASYESAKQSIQGLDAEIERVSSEGQGGELKLSGFDDGETTIESDTGTVEIYAEDGNGNPVVDRTGSNAIDLGTIRYAQDGRKLAYQGGGVFETSSKGATVVSPPPVSFRTRGGTPTLTFPVIEVEDDNVNAGVDGEITLERTGLTDLYNGKLPRGGTLEITVTSQYYEAWGKVLEERVGVSVSYDHDHQEVTLSVRTQKESVSGQVTAPIISARGETTAFDKAPIVDSYSSHPMTSNPVCQGGQDCGSVYGVSMDGIFTQSSTIYGELKVKELPQRASGTSEVYGNAYLGSHKNSHATKMTFDNWGSPMVFHQDVYINDWVKLGSVRIEGDLVSKSRVWSKNDHATVEGSVYDYGRRGSNDANLRGITIEEDLYVLGDLQVGKNVEVGGKVRVSGKIKGKKIKDLSGSRHSDVKGDIDRSNLESTMDTETSQGGDPEGSTYTGPTMDKPDYVFDQHSITPTNNDNGDVSDSQLDSSGNLGCVDGSQGSTCKLTAGDYYVKNIVLEQQDTLTLDTSGGNINIFVENSVELTKGNEIEIQGDGRVNVYVNDDFTMQDGADIVNPDDESKQFWVYLRPDGTASIKHDNPANPTEFRGVIYGPGRDSAVSTDPGAEIVLEGAVEYFGAAVGDVETVTHAGGTSPGNNPSIHYDQALSGTAVTGSSSSSSTVRVHYLQTAKREVTVS